ncbi:MAG: hypothetical protein QXX29_04275 [Nitrososphaerota archaeon]
MPRGDDAWLKAFISRICEQVEEYHGRPANYVFVKNLIERFIKNNPDADPVIDWVSYYDPRLEYSEILERLRSAYPQYRWEAEEERAEEFGEERYFSELLNYLTAQARELPPELRLRLIRELSDELGLSVEEAKELEERVAAEVKPPPPKKPEEKRPVVIDIQLLAKYPILDEARDFVSAFTFNEIDDDVYWRACERVVEAVEKGMVSAKLDDPLKELLSYPIAGAMIAYFNNDWLRRRYAYAEGRRMERLLVVEEPEVFEFVAMKVFDTFRIADGVEDDGRFGEYLLNFREYLQIVTRSGLNREPRWKLVNRVVKRGLVHLNAAEVARLVRAITQIAINNKLSQLDPRRIPERVRSYAESIRMRIGEAISRVRKELEAVSREMPPCIQLIQKRIIAGEDVSHFENFAIATYLLNAGRSVDEVLELFKHRSDYDERIARYQVEHIAGLRGGRTRYKPPSCDKLRSLGLCVEAGKHCPPRIRSPLHYRPGGDGVGAR